MGRSRRSKQKMITRFDTKQNHFSKSLLEAHQTFLDSAPSGGFMCDLSSEVVGTPSHHLEQRKELDPTDALLAGLSRNDLDVRDESPNLHEGY